MPVRITFPDEPSYLAFLGKAREVERFRADLEGLLGAFPELRAWAAAKPEAIVERPGEWPRIAAVLAWFRANQCSGLYLREVPAVEDTKFIEARKGLVRSLLDRIEGSGIGEGLSTDLPAPDHRVSFEERCGLKAVQPLVRLRVLDPRISETRLSGIDDLALPLDRLAVLDFSEIERVLVIENKASFSNVEVFLTAPAMRGTVALFGSGYGAGALGSVPWIASRRIGYWGDIDSHGLRILGAFRSRFPSAESLLMDEATFDRFPEYRADAPIDEAAEPEGLDPEELGLFRRLASLRAGNRLEQERIPLAYARRRLAAWAE